MNTNSIIHAAKSLAIADANGIIDNAAETALLEINFLCKDSVGDLVFNDVHNLPMEMRKLFRETFEAYEDAFEENYN